MKRHVTFAAPRHQLARPALLPSLMLTALCSGAAHAATFAVTNTNNSGAGSLRQAITDANAAAGADTVDASGVTGTISLESHLPDVVDSLTVKGPGAAQLTVAGTVEASHYIFAVAPEATLNISGLTTTHGNAPWSFGTHGIVSFGTLAVSDCAFIGSESGILTFRSATINSSTFKTNVTGIYKYSGDATATNSTFSGNHVAFNNRELSGEIVNCTLSDNYNGIHNDPAGTVVVKNTICVENSENDLRGSGSDNIDVAGRNNIIGGSAADAGLDPNGLQDNGGSTQTIALLSGSPAIDAAGAGAPATDQRGYQRSGTADIGAFELQTAQNSAPVLSVTPATNAGGRKLPANAGFYLLTATDADDDKVAIYVYDSADADFFAGPFKSGDVIKITHTPGSAARVQPMGGGVAAHISVQGDASAQAFDDSNPSAESEIVVFSVKSGSKK